MAEQKEVSIHAKKYYRVVFHSIDKNKESIESFAIKMSMRLKTPIPRVMQILRHLPCSVKSGLSISQANRLYNVLEELGAKVSIESYFLTPGEEPGKSYSGDISIRSDGIRKKRPVKCPACGWDNEDDSEFCSLCLEAFKKKKEVDSIPQETPGRNPLIDSSELNTPDSSSLGTVFSKRLFIAALVLLAIAVIFVLKK